MPAMSAAGGTGLGQRSDRVGIIRILVLFDQLQPEGRFEVGVGFELYYWNTVDVWVQLEFARVQIIAGIQEKMLGESRSLLRK